MKKRLMFLISALVICSYVIGQTYTEVEKYYNKIAATHKVEKKLDGYNFYSITNKEAVEILGGCYHWGSSGNGSLALVVGENETYAVLDFAQDLFPNPPYSNVTGSVTEKAVFSHDGVWSVGKAGDKIIFRCFKCSVKIYLIDYKNTKWVGNHWTSPDKPTQFWFAVSTANVYGFRMGQLEWETMTKENVRLGGNQTAEHVLIQLEAERQAEIEARTAEEEARKTEERRIEQERALRESQTKRGTLGKNLKWELYDGTLTISGKGKMENLLYKNKNNAPWKAYIDSIISIEISDGITSIGHYIFKGCRNLTSVTIPSSIKSIGSWAFSGCTNLPSINIPNSVRIIGPYAFERCSQLCSISIPTGVDSIESGAFAQCKKLSSITIPDGVKSICSFAFNDCSSLTSITIPNSVTSIGEYAFSGCHSLTTITIPSSVNVGCIGDKAFDGILNVRYLVGKSSEIKINRYRWGAESVNGIVEGYLVYSSNGKGVLERCSPKASGEIIIPNSVTYISSKAFADCYKITSIIIPSSVTSIGYRAFYWCRGLTSLTIPKSVKKIDEDAFLGCSNLNLSLPKKLKNKVKTRDCKSVTYYK